MSDVRKFIPFLFFLLFLLSSCATTQPGVMLDTLATSAGELIRLVQAGNDRLTSLSGKGSLSIESHSMAGSAFFSLSLRKPDSLLVRLEGPFGIDVGTLFLSRDRFVVYNSFENSVVRGRPDSMTIRSLLPFDLDHHHLLEAFSGAFSIKETVASVRAYDIDDNRFRLVAACGIGQCTYWIDPGSLLVTGYRRTDGEGNVLLEAEVGSITDSDDVYAPRRIRISLPQSGQRISVYYNSIKINDPEPSFAFSVPSGATTLDR